MHPRPFPFITYLPRFLRIFVIRDLLPALFRFQLISCCVRIPRSRYDLEYRNHIAAYLHASTYVPIWAGCGGLSNLWGTACLLNDTRANGNYGIYNERHPRSVSERPFALSIPSHSDCIFLLGKRNCSNCQLHTGTHFV